MKRVSVLLILLIFCLSGCTGSRERANPVSTPDTHVSQDNSVIDIDTSKLVKVEVQGRLPISTESIKAVLTDTGRFTYNRVELPGGNIDLHFSLDKPDGDDFAGAARIFFSVLTENTTEIISYNFSKSEVNGNKQDTIKWGIDLVLHIFGTELTDETWADITEIASKLDDIGAMGADYEGYADEEAGIRLIYADLGENVQIDIRPY
jgi:hypothetical protein